MNNLQNIMQQARGFQFGNMSQNNPDWQRWKTAQSQANPMMQMNSGYPPSQNATNPQQAGQGQMFPIGQQQRNQNPYGGGSPWQVSS